MTTPRVTFAERPTLLLPPTLEVAGLDVPLATNQVALALAAGGPVHWPVCRPCHLGKTKGLDLEIRLEHLEEIARTYDPVNVEAAAINIDHARTGPAHGWIESYAVRDGLLFATVVDLSEELREGIKARRFTRQSMEIVTSHPVTGGWYGHGLAVLGANRPAVKGLPPITLSERPSYVFLRIADPPAAPAAGAEATPPPPPAASADPGQAGQPAAPAQGEAQEEVTMTTAANQPAAGATTASTPTTPSAPASPATPAAPPATVDLAEEGRRLVAAREQAEADARLVRRQSIELAVDRLLDGGDLAKKVTPAQRRAGVRELLIELRVQAHPTEVTLSAADGKTSKVSAFDAFVAVLKAQPDVGVLTAGGTELASSDEGAALALDDRTPEEKATHQRMGLSDEDALKLRADLRRRAQTR